ncbi:hypothetical protein A2U01_0058271, partial [Trifolium medium]|nr:hypothetical protein [Trifolium medium]
MGGGGAEV